MLFSHFTLKTLIFPSECCGLSSGEVQSLGQFDFWSVVFFFFALVVCFKLFLVKYLINLY